MAKLSVAGRTAELVFDMTSGEALEGNVGLLDNFDLLVTGNERLRTIRMAVSVLAAEGARLGKGEEMPAEWLLANVKPREFRKLGPAVRAAIKEGMAMENKSGEDEATDLILAEIEKKEDPDA